MRIRLKGSVRCRRVRKMEQLDAHGRSSPCALRTKVDGMEPRPRHLSRSIANHSPYVPGKQPEIGEETVKLNTNENPYPPSPSIKNAILGELESLRLYPNSPPTN